MRYVSAELHNHTKHSDGVLTPRELALAARAEGLEIVALTDHNTDSGLYDAPEGIITLLPGIEWTTFYGHFLALGGERVFDCLKAPRDGIDACFSRIRESGGAVGLAHPFDLGSPMCTGGAWDFEVRDFGLVDYIEVWHEAFPSITAQSERSRAFWLSLLRQGFKIAPVYGRDRHSLRDFDAPHARTLLGIEGEITVGKALDALKKGRTAITMAYDFTASATDGERIYSIGDSLPAGNYAFRFKTAPGSCETQWRAYDAKPRRIAFYKDGERLEDIAYRPDAELRAELDSGFCHAELEGEFAGEECVIAMTGAFYVD